MQFTTAFIAAAMALTVSAAPTTTSMATADPQWTIEGLNRQCDGDKSCTWKFSVNTHLSDATPCSVVVLANGKTPASQSNGGPCTCGPYTVTSGWSGQFGPGNGFTTFAVVDQKKRLIAYPAYTDNEVKDGKTVANRDYPSQKLPN